MTMRAEILPQRNSLASKKRFQPSRSAGRVSRRRTKVVAIIQARMGSTRLPGKVLKSILGRPMLERQIERVKQSRFISQIVVATTTKPADQKIVRLATRLGIPVFRGSEPNVLDRFYQAAKKFEADVIVRLTGDCPLIDSQFIDQVISLRKKHTADYASNRSLEKAVPSGMDAEAFTFKALKIAHRLAKSQFDQEHVTPFIFNHPRLFKLVALPIGKGRELSQWHLSVDAPKDLRLVRSMYARLYPQNPHFELADIVSLLRKTKIDAND